MKTIIATYYRYKQILPILILSAICISTIISFFKDEDSFILNVKHYGGFIAVTICITSYFVVKVYYKYLLLFVLFLGFFNIINFTPSLRTVFLGFGKAEIGFQPNSFYVILLAYIINYKRANKFIISQIQSINTKISLSEEGLNLNKIDKFKERYKEYSDDKLQQILNENEFVPEALEAARQTLHNRKIKLNN